ncbi:M15 family metallopeptidase [Maridesulfovibrio salexigens]|uniref:D-alanyl-D-alanine dipeptidase n=1 Tax=Maridesulfovibrio salexigens (strain ATCC 14822 / DSM 2638 / NCIMB 8403 / VKM B-1763) TaxID=526222 RepID=C6BZX2_MARSD|nr:M15 family metallopeptidase [Maridesulfovibrio salexigens]ACS79029.1 D-Ala-D-Ala dipeptidase [Maridesulfovibrio salexigens DSM 2638]
MRSFKYCVLAIVLSTLFSFSVAFCGQDGLPDEFCYLDNILSDVVYDVRYFGNDNFVGERIDGYKAKRIILTRDAAAALAGAQKDLATFGLGLKIFDGYRPQDAVLHFVRWAEDLNDTRMKQKYYPGVQKKNLFRDGYIAEKSSHSRGSTVDLTIIDIKTGQELDMGTGFDHFGPESWPGNKDMSIQVRSNRALLREIMVRNGFKPLKEEWWHFTLEFEPFPENYFNFPIK